MKYTCQCCGYKIFDEPSGSYSICPICFWEDDAFQVDNPFCGGGANHVSLYQAQRNYEKFGACENRLVKYVRKPNQNDCKDKNWSKIDLPNNRIKELIIDLSDVNSIDDLHLLLMKSFGFPDFYGMNWDAFWDAITGLVTMPKSVIFKGWHEFELKFLKDSRILKSTFEDFENEYPEYSSKVKYLE